MRKLAIILFEIIIYIILICLNLISLLKIYYKRYDEIESMFSSSFLDYIVYMNLGSLHIAIGIVILILFYLFRKRKFYFRIILASMLIIVSTSCFYYEYYKNIKVLSESEKEIIESIKSKKKDYQAMSISNKFENLTFEEYQFISNNTEILSQAYDIDYEYTSDGFLPDYLLNLTYKVPLGFNIDTFNNKFNQSHSSQSFKIYKDHIEVKYSSGSW